MYIYMYRRSAESRENFIIQDDVQQTHIHKAIPSSYYSYRFTKLLFYIFICVCACKLVFLRNWGFTYTYTLFLIDINHPTCDITNITHMCMLEIYTLTRRKKRDSAKKIRSRNKNILFFFCCKRYREEVSALPSHSHQR